MLIYKLDHEEQIWRGIYIEKTLNIGLNKKNELVVASSVPSNFGQLLPILLSNQKERTVLLLKKNCGIKLNGMSPFTLSVLCHKDELSYRRQKIYFSMERPVHIIEFDTRKNGKVNCPRCKDIIVGDSVQCPKCRLWFHESEKEERQCWSYDNKCFCGYPTDVKAVWKPKPVKPKIKREDRCYDKTK